MSETDDPVLEAFKQTEEYKKLHAEYEAITGKYPGTPTGMIPGASEKYKEVWAAFDKFKEARIGKLPPDVAAEVEAALSVTDSRDLPMYREVKLEGGKSKREFHHWIIDKRKGDVLTFVCDRCREMVARKLPSDEGLDSEVPEVR